MALSALFGGTVFLAAFCFLAHRGSRLVTGWGALWAVPLGLWLIAPFAISVHYLRPSALQHWIILDTFFAVVFAALGAVASCGIATTTAIYSFGRRGEFRNPAWAYGIWAVAGLPYGYLGLSAFLEWWNLHHITSTSTYLSSIGPAVAAHAGLIALLLVIYYRYAAHGWDHGGRTLQRCLTAASVAGFAALPFRIAGAPAPVRAADPPLVMAVAGKPTPLLVIGLDGGNWRSLRPMLGRASMPTFSRLAAEGVQGDIEALWPQYWSTPAWGAILTGHPGDELGVHEDLAASAPGLPPFELPLTLDPALTPLFLVEYALVRLNVIEPMPASRDMLLRTPIWERLTQAGLKTAVVRFPFTYPAGGQAAYVISNRAVTDLWGMLSVAKGDPDKLVAPVAETQTLLAPFSDDESEDLRTLAQLLPDVSAPKPRDALVDPVGVLKQVERDSRQMQEAAVRLIRRDPELSVVMLHISAFDNICHAFWQYRFPEDFADDPPKAADVTRLGGVIDRSLELLDRQLAELIAAFPTPPNVLIVSDHGEGPTNTNAMWRGWHASPGIFLMAGPDIPHRAEHLADVSYYDIAPTILGLQGIERPADLHGRSLVQVR